MAFAVSAKMLKAVQVFITTFFGLCSPGSAVEQSQHPWKSLCVCLLHMRICSTDVSWLPGSRLSSPGLFGSDCDMVTHSSIWSSNWVTQGKLNDTAQYITCFSRPAMTVEQIIFKKILEQKLLSLSSGENEDNALVSGVNSRHMLDIIRSLTRNASNQKKWLNSAAFLLWLTHCYNHFENAQRLLTFSNFHDPTLIQNDSFAKYTIDSTAIFAMFILVLTLTEGFFFVFTQQSLKVKCRTYMRMLIKLSPIASNMKDRRLQIKPSKLPKEHL